MENPDPALEARNPFRLAFDLFLDRVLHYIGAYHLKLNGEVDALVFAGGIGERGVEFREIIGQKIACLGYPPIRQDKNLGASAELATVVDISTAEQVSQARAKRILVCKTNEQVGKFLNCQRRGTDFIVIAGNGKGVHTRRKVLERCLMPVDSS